MYVVVWSFYVLFVFIWLVGCLFAGSFLSILVLVLFAAIVCKLQFISSSLQRVVNSPSLQSIPRGPEMAFTFGPLVNDSIQEIDDPWPILLWLSAANSRVVFTAIPGQCQSVLLLLLLGVRRLHDQGRSGDE